MKLGIAWRIGLTVALVGVLAAGLTGYYSYRTSREMLVRAAETRLLTATKVLGQQIIAAVHSRGQDVRSLASLPDAVRILTERDPRRRAVAEEALTATFIAMMKTHPGFFQMRLIAADENGMERVRVDRNGDELLPIVGDDLQEKGHTPYVFQTLRLQRDQFHVSRAIINHELGAHAGEERPSIHVTAPIHGPGKSVLGLIVINIDLDSTFRNLGATLPPTLALYLTNQDGDFLVHPDPTQAFAFDRGQQARVQEQFPTSAALIEGRQDSVLIVQQGMVAAFVRQTMASAQPIQNFVIGLSQPLATVLEESDRLGRSTLQIVLAFSVLALLVAILFARALTHPLNQMVKAVRHFGSDRAPIALPQQRHDEIGVLARSFAEMQQQIRNQMANLHEKQDELDHLASHDSLTGLPNRRMFLDRLDHALAQGRRHGEGLAILYLDLDKFKEINDRLGHAAGDVVLRCAADRMRDSVREIDTVARLGGDEFIILLEGAHDTTALAQVAQKLIDGLSDPVSHAGELLRVGASVGIGRYPEDGQNATELIAAADRALYQAKNSGRNCYRVATTA